MSILTSLTWLWRHKPSAAELAAVEAVGRAAAALIDAIRRAAPDNADRQAAIERVEQAATHTTVALAREGAGAQAAPPA